MEERLTELIQKKFLTRKEMFEIYLTEGISMENNGYSGSFVGYHWATVADEEEEYDIYFKIEE